MPAQIRPPNRDRSLRDFCNLNSSCCNQRQNLSQAVPCTLGNRANTGLSYPIPQNRWFSLWFPSKKVTLKTNRGSPKPVVLPLVSPPRKKEKERHVQVLRFSLRARPSLPRRGRRSKPREGPAKECGGDKARLLLFCGGIQTMIEGSSEGPSSFFFLGGGGSKL